MNYTWNPLRRKPTVVLTESEWRRKLIRAHTGWLLVVISIVLYSYGAVGLYPLVAEALAVEVERPVAMSEQPIIRPVPERAPIEELYHRFENDLAFRDYITDLKVKRNNPGNLRFANQPGATNNNGFAEFKSNLLGFRALVIQVEAYQKKNHTIKTFLERYAPPSENDTKHLIREMCNRLGATADTYIFAIDTITLAQDITRQEHGIKY